MPYPGAQALLGSLRPMTDLIPTVRYILCGLVPACQFPVSRSLTLPPAYCSLLTVFLSPPLSTQSSLLSPEDALLYTLCPLVTGSLIGRRFIANRVSLSITLLRREQTNKSIRMPDTNLCL